MTAGKAYEIKVAGIRNPRYLLINADLSVKQKFKIYTYDSYGTSDTVNLIDVGEGGEIDMEEISPIETFSAEAYNTTNGVWSMYSISWFTSILTQNNDLLIINFPKESTIAKDPNCLGITGISKYEVDC